VIDLVDVTQHYYQIRPGWRAMKRPADSDERATRGSALGGILKKLCPRCRRGSIFAAPLVMHDNCPECGLDFDRGDPGYFTGAMYVSYALAIPWLALLTLIEHMIMPSWSLFRLVVLASLISLPLVPWIWQYSRVVWMYFDQYFDPEGEESDRDGIVLNDREPG
jgi:uncharacterized protein (DUF983 family)